jgi:hypothetical protein
MMSLIDFSLILYAFGIIPFPNRYVTWFEQSRPTRMIAIWAGTMEKATSDHLPNTSFSKSKYGFLQPGKTLLA